MKGGTKLGLALALAVAAGQWVAPPAAIAASFPLNCDTGNLQAAIDVASPGATILLKGTCVGNFTIDKRLTLKGDPSATLDGDDLGTTLTISGSPHVHLVRLTVTGGLGPNGGGILNGGGFLTLNQVTVQENLAIDPSDARGGGIFSDGGSLTLKASSILNNLAYSGEDGVAEGGGIYSLVPLTLDHSTVGSNRATNSSGGGNGTAYGGGIESHATLNIVSSLIRSNRATAFGATTMRAQGGGIDAEGSDLTISSSAVRGNMATTSSSGGGDATTNGGGLEAQGGTATITRSAFTGNQAIARSPSGNPAAYGGAIDGDQSLVIKSSELSLNSVTSQGAGLAFGLGGGIRLTGLTAVDFRIRRSIIDRNRLLVTSSAGNTRASGGGVSSSNTFDMADSTVSGNSIRTTVRGAHFSDGRGGGLNLQSSPTPIPVVNSTIANNVIEATAPSGTGSSSAEGAGIYSIGGPISMTNSTVSGNTLAAAGHSPSVRGGGINVPGGSATTIEATILARNVASEGPDCAGDVVSNGHNLVRRKSGGCQFDPTDKLNVDPKLGPLAANGGPTKTMALLVGSPAIDAIPEAACAVSKDQRGVTRPQGPRCDIGAYERKV